MTPSDDKNHPPTNTKNEDAESSESTNVSPVPIIIDENQTDDDWIDTDWLDDYRDANNY